MKVAIVIEHFDATRGGAEHLAVWLARELAGRGHEVHVVCHDVSARVNRYRQATERASFVAQVSHAALPSDEVTHDGIHVHRLKGMRVNTAIGTRRFGMRARAWVARHRPEVVHSLTVAYPGDVYHACTGVYAAMVAQTRGTGAKEGVLKRMMRGLSMRERTVLALERRAIAGRLAAKRLISVGSAVTGQLREVYGVDDRRIVEMASPRLDMHGDKTHAQEWEARERAWFRGHYRLGEKDRVALFVGHDFRRKGLKYAIEAIARTRTGWKLVVVGLGRVREYVEQAEQLGIGEGCEGGSKVLFVGPTKELERIYPAGDALILPTFYEASGAVVLEALSHGLPVISTEHLAASDVVRREVVGRIVASPRAVEEMAEALDGLPAEGTTEGWAMKVRARAAGAGVPASEYIEGLLALYERVRKDRD